jgi:voltage-gated potassium channel
MESERRQEALERFERAVELPLIVLAVAMVPLLILPLLLNLPDGVEAGLIAADWFIWAVFTFEYGVRLILTTDRWRFVRREWPDLLIVVLPILRPLRVVRSARALRLLRMTRLLAVFGEIGTSGRKLLVRHRLHYALLATLAVTVASAVLMLSVEESGEGSIETFGDALWWATTTVTTVGYGDTYPVSPAGRAIATFLMISGIALFGVLTANIAAFFVERSTEAEEADQIEAKLDEIIRRLDTFEQRLKNNSEGGAAP